ACAEPRYAIRYSLFAIRYSLFAICSGLLPPLRGVAMTLPSSYHRRGLAFDHHIDARGLAARKRALDRAGEIGSTLDEFAVAAERGRHLVVARRQQLTAVHALLAVVAQLNLALRVPARVVAEHGDKREPAPHRGLELGDVEADGAVAEHGKHRRRRVHQLRGHGEGERASDRAGDAVDETLAHREHALAPLGKLAAVADEHGVRVALDVRAQHAEHFGRMQPARHA